MRSIAGVIPKGDSLSYYDWESVSGSGGVAVLIPLKDPSKYGPRDEHKRPVLVLGNIDGSVAVHVDESGVGSVDLLRILDVVRDFDLDAERTEPESLPFPEATMLSHRRALRLAKRLLSILS